MELKEVSRFILYFTMGRKLNNIGTCMYVDKYRGYEGVQYMICVSPILKLNQTPIERCSLVEDTQYTTKEDRYLIYDNDTIGITDDEFRRSKHLIALVEAKPLMRDMLFEIALKSLK